MSEFRPCFLQIVTSADGEESVFSAEAEMALDSLSAILRYRQGDGFVCMTIAAVGVRIEREGDYRLRLCFTERKIQPGILSIGGAEGSVETHTHRLGYSVGENSVLLSMKYTLRFDSGKQEMKIRLLAQGINNPEEK